ncbi:wnk kinase isoform m [Anaeramoeba ignava]|uniref:non-specific serine/threonine protein kinase n=1 Tax=Anaeramoeba ignava TaxID=1746090 RepID=A0A9Q0L5P8_ANAIG|nr:wnk kinase isoform m [Anaeramoeba ignava]
MFQSDKFVQVEKHGKYTRYSKLLGRGAIKTVYYAIDTEMGCEVAWNQVKLDHLTQMDAEKLFREIKLLHGVEHKAIIKLIDTWLDSENRILVFITQIMPSGSLRNYIDKVKSLSTKAIRNFSRQILEGIYYLHSRDPPIIHRDIKCDNIFFDGSKGKIKIGDLGESTLKLADHVKSVIGTPNFMAPELYDEHYTEKVDIYAFGMCILEMATGDYPYFECENAAQIFRKVLSGKKPLSIEKVKDPEILEIINLCILPELNRPSAEQLLQHPFFEKASTPSIPNETSNENEENIDSKLEKPLHANSAIFYLDPNEIQSQKEIDIDIPVFINGKQSTINESFNLEKQDYPSFVKNITSKYNLTIDDPEEFVELIRSIVENEQKNKKLKSIKKFDDQKTNSPKLIVTPIFQQKDQSFQKINEQTFDPQIQNGIIYQDEDKDKDKNEDKNENKDKDKNKNENKNENKNKNENENENENKNEK